MTSLKEVGSSLTMRLTVLKRNITMKIIERLPLSPFGPLSIVLGTSLESKERAPFLDFILRSCAQIFNSFKIEEILHWTYHVQLFHKGYCHYSTRSH